MTRETEQKYLQTVQQWLAAFGLSAEAETHEAYAILRVAGKTLVLDYLRFPYQKPEVAGFHFGIDYFIFHQEALQSRLASIFYKTKTVFARNCTVARINKQTAETFFAQNHLSGYAKAKIKYALWHRGEIAAAITFAEGRNVLREGKNLRSYELIGFCHAAGITVTGGMSKLIKAFLTERQADHIATTVDLDWATGRGLAAIGFRQTALLPPLSFTLDWQTGQRKFPNRADRATETFSAQDYPYQNAGFAKFEHIYTP